MTSAEKQARKKAIEAELDEELSIYKQFNNNFNKAKYDGMCRTLNLLGISYFEKSGKHTVIM